MPFRSVSHTQRYFPGTVGSPVVKEDEVVSSDTEAYTSGSDRFNPSRRHRAYVKGQSSTYDDYAYPEWQPRTGRLSFAMLRQIYERSSYVRPCVDALVRSVSSLPWVVRPKRNGKARDAEEVKEFLRDPNSNEESLRKIFGQVLTDVVVIDEGIVEKVKAFDGTLLELFARDGSTFIPIKDEHGILHGYIQKLGVGDPVPFEKDEVMYFELYPTTWTAYGLPIIETIVNEVASLMFSVQWIADSFTEDKIPPGILTLDRVGNDAYERAKAEFQGGEDSQFTVKLFRNVGKAQWIELKKTNQEMQLAELNLQIERIVYRNFGLQPFELGVTSEINRACYSSDTQTLTENGWKYHWEIGEGERIAAYNPETMYLEYHKPIQKFVYDYEGEMIHFKNRAMDILVTPDHRMFLREPTGPGKWHIQEAQSINYNQTQFRAKCEYEGEEIEYFEIPEVPYEGTWKNRNLIDRNIPMDALLNFLGWWISEGSLSLKPGDWDISVRQKTEENYPKIRKALENLPFEVHEDVKKDGGHRFRFSDKSMWHFLHDQIGFTCFNKRIPSVFKNLSRRQLRILWESLVDGDGHRCGYKNATSIEYYTSSKELCDDVQEIALKLGYSTSCELRRLVEKRTERATLGMISEVWRVRSNLTKGTPTIRRAQIQRVPYSGHVYCFEVPNHLFITRRNGKIAIQGNTAEMALRVSQSRVFKPLTQMVNYAMNQNLVSPVFPDVYFKLIPMDLGDPLTRAQTIATYVKQEILTKTEARMLLEDEFFVEGGLSGSSDHVDLKSEEELTDESRTEEAGREVSEGS